MSEENSFTSLGTTLKVSATLPTTHNAAGFATVDASLVEVGGVDDIGERKIARNTSQRTPLKTGDEVSITGGARMDPFPVTGAILRGDAGQELLATHLRSGAKLSFCVTSPDGFKEYGVAVVTGGGNGTGAGGADAFAGMSYELKPSGLTVEVEAA